MDSSGKDVASKRKTDGLALDDKYWFPIANRDFRICQQLGRKGPACWAVWCFLLSLANKYKSLVVTASSRYVEKGASLSRPTVRSVLKLLCAAGMMDEVKQEGARVNGYDHPKKFKLHPSAGFESLLEGGKKTYPLGGKESYPRGGKGKCEKSFPNITTPSLKEGDSNNTNGGSGCVSENGLRPFGHPAAIVEEETDAQKAERLGML